MKLLTRYWFEFDGDPTELPVGVGLGIGVTAFSRDDALAIIRRDVFEGEPVPPIAREVENVGVSELDEGHVLPNMEPPVWRGVWYPRSFARPA